LDDGEKTMRRGKRKITRYVRSRGQEEVEERLVRRQKEIKERLRRC
jgi:hypothetical protein